MLAAWGKLVYRFRWLVLIISGIGMGIAVVMDATIVRCLIVPATMQLLGRWNWWAPGPMNRLYRFVALRESREDSAG